MKRTPKSVKASCDRLWSTVIRTRARGRCERCGKSPDDSRALHAHHVYGRVNHRLRWELRNGMALCYRCHMWAENYPLDFADWFREIRWDDAEWLQVENRRGLVKRNLEDYLRMESELSDMLAP